MSHKNLALQNISNMIQRLDALDAPLNRFSHLISFNKFKYGRRTKIHFLCVLKYITLFRLADTSIAENKEEKRDHG